MADLVPHPLDRDALCLAGHAGCGYPPGHTSEHPCGQPHVPGSPCRFCGRATPLDGGPCWDCWTPIPKSLADAKALFARSDLSLDRRPRIAITGNPCCGGNGVEASCEVCRCD